MVTQEHLEVRETLEDKETRERLVPLVILAVQEMRVHQDNQDPSAHREQTGSRGRLGLRDLRVLSARTGWLAPRDFRGRREVSDSREFKDSLV